MGIEERRKQSLLQVAVAHDPCGELWNEYCRRCNVPEDGVWFPEVQRYEKEVLEART